MKRLIRSSRIERALAGLHGMRASGSMSSCSQGPPACAGPEHFLQEFDFLEDRALDEFFCLDPVDEKG